MKIDATEARTEFASVVNRVAFGGERIVLSRYGRAVAAIVPVCDLEQLERDAGATPAAPAERPRTKR